MPKVRLFAVAESDSSTVAKWGYDPASKTLAVVFRRAANTEYQYEDVPQELVDRVFHDPESSIGACINSLVKPGRKCIPIVSTSEEVPA